MDIRFLPHNQHWQSAELFSQRDPNLVRLASMPLVYTSSLLEDFPLTEPGIYSLTGGRQIGKTTLLKQWMQHLLERGVAPAAIAYITGEIIDDHHSLLMTIQSLLEHKAEASRCYLIIDEVTYIRGWDKAIKFLADSGQLQHIVLLLTGSDSMLIQQARSRFPGRRGAADQVDFHLYPLSFRETVELKYDSATLAQAQQGDFHSFLSQALMEYLQHGGYLTAINDMAQYQRILPATLRTYADWIRGDMLKHGKQERYLREIFSGIIKRYGSQLSWNSLAADLSIDHPRTVADYIELLAAMDALFVQYALQMDKLTAAPKKARKVVFSDPFILHAIRAWLAYDYQTATPLTDDPKWCGQLVESVVTNHFARQWPTYYLKTTKGEVDIAAVKQREILAIEIKWTSQLRTQDLKLIRQIKGGRVWARVPTRYELDGLTIESLPVALFNTG